MTPALLDLARRFVAAGAPVPTLNRSAFGGPPALLTPGLADLPEGRRWRCPDGLRYEVATVDGALCLLPLLTDPCWLGWTLAEVERRGYAYAAESVGGETRVNIWRAGWVSERYSSYMSRESALVAMLEATRHLAAPEPATTLP